MKTMYLAGIAAVSLALTSCARDDSALTKRLDSMDSKLASIEQKLGQIGAGRPMAQPAQRRGPQPGTVYSIPVDNVPFKGNPDAKVTIVEAMEFACPACEATRPFVAQLLEELGDRVKLVQKSFIVHPGRAEPGSYAACAANRQGKFVEMEKLIWDEGFKAGKLDKENMRSLAGKIGLDVDRFAADMDGVCVEQVKTEHQGMQAIGTTGTPTFFINGKVLPQRTLDAVKAMVDAEEKLAGERIAQGTKPQNYYKEWIVDKGKKTM